MPAWHLLLLCWDQVAIEADENKASSVDPVVAVAMESSLKSGMDRDNMAEEERWSL